MYGQPIRVQPSGQGFTPSRFSPMRQIGAIVAPAVVPAVLPAPGPVVVERPPAFVLPPAQPVFVTETAGMSDETKTIVAIAAAIGLFALGAAIG